MFGMGITEILLIAIVAVIALGPEKLPDAMVKIAKMFNSVKKGISDAKTTLDNELNIAELKEEANKFKAQIEDTKSSLSIENKFNLGLDDILKDDLEPLKNDNEVEKIKEKFAKVNEDKAKKSENEKFSLKNNEGFLNEVSILGLPFSAVSDTKMDPFFFHYYMPSNNNNGDILYFFTLLLLESFLRGYLKEINTVAI